MLRKASSKFVHNSAVTTLRGTNPDLKLLQNLISAEKTVLSTLEKLSADYTKASEALRAWGLVEGDDLGGILTASSLLLNHFSLALSQYASHSNLMRRQLKAVRTRAENLDDLKRQRRSIYRKAEEAERQWKNMDPDHKNFLSRTEALHNFREAAREMNSKIKLEEAALADFKRTSTKMWMGLKFGGLVECCEKGTIAGKFGKLVIAEIPEEITQPGAPRTLNYRRNEVESCVANAHRGVNAVTLSTVPFVGFRDRDQYIQRSSETPSTPPAAFYISSQMGHGEQSDNRPLESSLLDEPEGHQLHPSFPEPECSCEPLSLGDQPAGSRTSLPYAQETPGPSLPQTLPETLHSHEQPEVIVTVDASDHGVNVVASSSTVTNPVASPNTDRGIIAAASVLNVPATVTGPVPVASSDSTSLNSGGGHNVAPVRLRRLATFGTGKDPYSMRDFYKIAPDEKPEETSAPPEGKKSVWAKITKLFN